MAQTPVTAYMSRRLLIVSDDCSPEAATEMMLASGRRHLVVLDAWGTFLGILSSGDLFASRRTSVAEVANPAVYLSPTASMHEAASMMLTYSVDAVGVLDADGGIVGILTWSDILRLVAGRGRP